MNAATETATAYDRTRPPEGFKVAVENGDLNALGAAADWLRDRGQPADPENPGENPSDEERAFGVEVLRGEWEVRHAMARANRRLLEIHPRHPQADPPRLSGRNVGRVFAEHGIHFDGVRGPGAFWVSLVGGQY